MTKSALAEFAWLERRYLREIECGDKKPTVNAIYSICEALRVSPLEFFTMVEAEILRPVSYTHLTLPTKAEV